MPRSLAALAGSILIVVASIGCATSTDDDGASPNPEPGVTATTPSASPDGRPPTVQELLDRSGCQGELIEPQLYTNEVGRCTLAGHELDVATFATNAQRDQWVAFVEDLEATVVTGDLWAVAGFDTGGTEAFVEALD